MPKTKKMTLSEFSKRFTRIKELGWVQSSRRGSTGIGKTLESLLNLPENNVATPDLGNIELKAHRAGSSSLITLFTFNRNVWKMKPLEAIKNHGTPDINGRLGLYFTMSRTPNSTGLFLHIEEDAISVRHISGSTIAEWQIQTLAERFMQKLPSLILVSAFSEMRGDLEWFKFERAQLLAGTSADIIRSQILEGNILVDLRLHDKITSARNHGTASARVKISCLYYLEQSRIYEMQRTIQLSLLEKPTKNTLDEWTFNGASTRELTHCYHDYPARMIPQVAGKLLDLFGKNAKTLFDPYCGTGTSLVESNIRGLNAIGTDLNPLARLIARGKTSIPNTSVLEKEISRFNKAALNDKLSKFKETPKIYGISRLDFWFKPQVIQKLFEIRKYISGIGDEDVRIFFQIAFSETVRESSNTRNEEFKLYRYGEEKLRKFNPDVYEIMVSKLNRNIVGYRKFKAIIDNFKRPPKTQVYGFNSVEGISQDIIAPETIDLVVTSPPYGDSGTTVAYGQYSRLSAAWLELQEPDKIDRKLMGNKIPKEITPLPSDPLNIAIESINRIDEKRAREVLSFYTDLNLSIKHVSNLIKTNGYVCYVVGNRKVKGLVLPTDIAVKNFFENSGFEYINTFTRSIPNKRMPLRNSPTNAPGVLDNTMTQEYIVVMQRKETKSISQPKKTYQTKSQNRKRETKKSNKHT